MTKTEQLREIDGLIDKLERSVVGDPRPSVLANIRALEKERRRVIGIPLDPRK